MACSSEVHTNTVLGYPDLVALAQSVGLSQAQAKTAAAIAVAESGGRAGSLNPCGADQSYGLWQINMKGNLGPARMAALGLTSYDQLYDPTTNARAMAMISGGGSHWGDWSTYNSGAYKAYLGGGADIGTGAQSNPTDLTNTTGVTANPCLIGGGTIHDPIPGLPNADVPCVLYQSQGWAIVGALALMGGALVVLAGVYMIARGSTPGLPTLRPLGGGGLAGLGSRSGSVSRGGLTQPLQTEGQIADSNYYARQQAEVEARPPGAQAARARAARRSERTGYTPRRPPATVEERF